MNIYLAVDLGASSGRVMAGIESEQEGTFELKELHRFINAPERSEGRLIWNYARLWDEIKVGLKEAGKLGGTVISVGVCSWGVDYVLVRDNGELTAPPYAYRDNTFEIYDLPLDLYERTGILPQSINTIYQLMAQDTRVLEQSATILFTADLFHYLLSGVPVTEQSLASTSGLLDVETGEWAWDVIDAAGLPRHMFGPISPPGTVIGPLREDLEEELGFSCSVTLPCSHDTANAYLAVPISEEIPSAILSSGTWSLLGCELPAAVTTKEAQADGFTNEKGYGGKTLLLQNLSGMWLIQEIRRQEAPDQSWDDLAELAATADGFTGRINPADERFLAPASMAEEIRQACKESGQEVPDSLAEVLSTVYHSLAETYAKKIEALGVLTGQEFQRLHIVGGGSKDRYLKELTKAASGLEILSGPTEGSALGNILVQMIAHGRFESEKDARRFLKHWLKFS